MSNQQIKSKKRVADHGEVFTNPREVNAMLNLVADECRRIESRFLEPACGTGNFLVEILNRKLQEVDRRYRKSQVEYERYAVSAICSIYGIELLEDNATICRERLSTIAHDKYLQRFPNSGKSSYQRAVRYIVSQNILQGDALTLKQANGKPIIFPEWSFPFHDNRLQRRDYIYQTLVERKNPESTEGLPLFSHNEKKLQSDLDKDVFIPQPLPKKYPLTHYLEVGNV